MIFSETPKLLKRGRTPIIGDAACGQCFCARWSEVSQPLCTAAAAETGCTVILYGKITSKKEAAECWIIRIFIQKIVCAAAKKVFSRCMADGRTDPEFLYEDNAQYSGQRSAAAGSSASGYSQTISAFRIQLCLETDTFSENEEACRMARKRLVLMNFLFLHCR